MEISLSQIRANRVGMKQELKKVEEMDRKGNTKLFKENKMVTPKSIKKLARVDIRMCTTGNHEEQVRVQLETPNPKSLCRKCCFSGGKNFSLRRVENGWFVFLQPKRE